MGMCFAGEKSCVSVENADNLIIPSQMALPQLNGQFVLTFITIICQSLTSSYFFSSHFLLSGPKELKQLYSNVLVGALFLFPTLSFLPFFFPPLNVNCRMVVLDRKRLMGSQRCIHDMVMRFKFVRHF